MHPLLAFFPLTESTSESPLSLPATLPRYGEGLDLSPFPILAFTAADLAAPRLVDPFRPRHEDRCGAYRFDDIYHPMSAMCHIRCCCGDSPLDYRPDSRKRHFR
jgi:hypothetical protein